MPTDDAMISAHAKRLFAARREGQPTQLVTDLTPSITPNESIAIAQRTLGMRGSAVTGFKLGYTSEAMRRQMNIDRPNYGSLTEDMDFSAGANGPLIHPRVEPEIAIRTSRDLYGPLPSVDDLTQAIDAIFPALEIVDTRYPDYVFKYEDNIADNSSAAGYVLGTPQQVAAIDGGIGVRLMPSDGPPIEGNSSAAMGNPLMALLWLCEELSRTGQGIPAGSIILTGGLTAAPYIRRNEAISADFGPLGRVSFTW